jgi:hypothetical protein
MNEADEIAEMRRHNAIDHAVALAKSRGEGTGATEVVAEAKLIEAYLRGDAPASTTEAPK